MREIGGYIELDMYNRPMFHEKALALNCGRNALAYLIEARKIRRIWLPKFICDSVTEVCEREGVPYSFYNVGLDFRPVQTIQLDDGEWFYFVNYYSQFDNKSISELVGRYPRMIVDNAQSYFQAPLQGIDTLYTCRKFFGVADGAFLYTESRLDREIPLDESFERMHFLLGRFERTASEFYGEYAANNDLFSAEPIKRMSKLTNNLLHGIDYEHVKEIRERNFLYLHNALGHLNGLELAERPGTFMYPLLLDNGSDIRKHLQQIKIYVPILWPNVLEWCGCDETEHRMAKNILPLPIDQRYGEAEMECMVREIRQLLNIQ